MQLPGIDYKSKVESRRSKVPEVRNLGLLTLDLGPSTIAVLGNGPSINDVDLSVLKKSEIKTIGVNVISLRYDPDYLVFLDRSVWEKHENLIRSSKARLFVSNNVRLPAGIEFEQFSRYRPINDDPILSGNFDNGLFYSFTSVMAAINLAYVMGTTQIILLGVDMHDQAHFYSIVGQGRPFLNVKLVIEHFNRLAEFAKDKGFEILNANPDSRVRCFPFVNINDISSKPRSSARG